MVESVTLGDYVIWVNPCLQNSNHSFYISPEKKVKKIAFPTQELPPHSSFPHVLPLLRQVEKLQLSDALSIFLDYVLLRDF